MIDRTTFILSEVKAEIANFVGDVEVLDRKLRSSDPAYLIFTSRRTGRPKGVPDLRSMLNSSIPAHSEALHLGPRRMLL